jgi:Fe-S cluster assembly iron-binding protein IscA
MNITEQAKIELKKAVGSFNIPGAGIHIVSSQGCCGPSIQMEITTNVGHDESVISIEGIDFIVASDLWSILANVTIEFSEKGFKLTGLQKNGSCCS